MTKRYSDEIKAELAKLPPEEQDMLRGEQWSPAEVLLMLGRVKIANVDNSKSDANLRYKGYGEIKVTKAD